MTWTTCLSRRATRRTGPECSERHIRRTMSVLCIDVAAEHTATRKVAHSIEVELHNWIRKASRTFARRVLNGRTSTGLLTRLATMLKLS